MRTVSAVVGFGLLTACSSTDASFDAYAEFAALTDKLAGLSDTAPMPTSGSASYEGVYALGEDTSDVGYAGPASVDVNFASGDIDGTVDDFERIAVDGMGNVVSRDSRDGSLVITGSVDGANPVLPNATISGTLEIASGSMSTIGGGATIGFAGPGADMLIGSHDPVIDGVAAPDWFGLVVAD